MIAGKYLKWRKGTGDDGGKRQIFYAGLIEFLELGEVVIFLSRKMARINAWNFPEELEYNYTRKRPFYIFSDGWREGLF